MNLVSQYAHLKIIVSFQNLDIVHSLKLCIKFLKSVDRKCSAPVSESPGSGISATLSDNLVCMLFVKFTVMARGYYAF